MSNLGVPWTEAELAVIRRPGSHVLQSYIDLLPGRTKHAVYSKLQQNKIHVPRPLYKGSPWTPERVAQLKSLIPTNTEHEIAALMGMKRGCLRRKMRHLKLKFVKKKQYKWTPEQDLELMRLLEKHPLSHIAKVFKKSKLAIKSRMVRIGAGRSGIYSITSAMEVTGYNKPQVHRAIDALQLVVRRRSKAPNAGYIISHEQIELISSYLLLEGTGLESGIRRDMEMYELDRYLTQHGYKNVNTNTGVVNDAA